MVGKILATAIVIALDEVVVVAATVRRRRCIQTLWMGPVGAPGAAQMVACTRHQYQFHCCSKEKSLVCFAIVLAFGATWASNRVSAMAPSAAAARQSHGMKTHSEHTRRPRMMGGWTCSSTWFFKTKKRKVLANKQNKKRLKPFGFATKASQRKKKNL